MIYRPPQCSEREPDGQWEDCLWCSLVMLGNAAYAFAQYPSTQHEYEALRRASGDSMSGGSNMDDGVKGMDARWGWHGRVVTDCVFAIKALQVGEAIALGGSMGRLSAHYRRWDPQFTGPHTAFVERDEHGYWWMNPQAPETYLGEYILLSELVKYAGGLPGGRAMVVVVGSRRSSRLRVTITGYTPLYAAPNGARLNAVRLATYICTRTKVPNPKTHVLEWWYRIGTKVDGSHTKNAGKCFKPNHNVKAVYA